MTDIRFRLLSPDSEKRYARSVELLQREKQPKAMAKETDQQKIYWTNNCLMRWQTSPNCKNSTLRNGCGCIHHRY